MELKERYDLRGIPNRAEYKRNENGLYTLDIKDYVVVAPDGQKHKAYLRFPNAKLTTADEEGVIHFYMDDISYFSATDEQGNTLFEITIPNIKD